MKFSFLIISFGVLIIIKTACATEGFKRGRHHQKPGSKFGSRRAFEEKTWSDDDEQKFIGHSDSDDFSGLEESDQGYSDDDDSEYDDYQYGGAGDYGNPQSSQRRFPRRLPAVVQAPVSSSSGGGVTGAMRNVLLRPKDPTKPGLQKQLQSAGQSAGSIMNSMKQASHRMTRDLKEYFAGDVEAAMLKVTRPDDYSPDPLTMDSIVRQTEHFEIDEDVTSKSNCYRQLLTKIWNKLAEEDWRTTAKALLLLHKLLRTVKPEDGRCIKIFLMKMSREVHDRRTMERCFSPALIRKTSCGPDHRRMEDFLGRYSAYVLQRGFIFTAGFAELRLMHKLRHEDGVAILYAAKKLLAKGLACRLRADEETEVTAACLELLAADLCDLWAIFHDKLRWAADQRGKPGGLFAGYHPDEVAATLRRLADFYARARPEVDAFAQRADALCALHGLHLHTALDLPPAHAFRELEDEQEQEAPQASSNITEPEGGRQSLGQTMSPPKNSDQGSTDPAVAVIGSSSSQTEKDDGHNSMVDSSSNSVDLEEKVVADQIDNSRYDSGNMIDITGESNDVVADEEAYYDDEESEYYYDTDEDDSLD